MNTLNSVDKALDNFEAFYWLDGIASALSALHRKFERPSPPPNSFGRTPAVLPFLRIDRVGNVAGYEMLAVDAYNDGVKAAYRCIDWHYVGLLSAISNETKGPENWNAYYREAKAELHKYFGTDEAFSDFEAYLLGPAQAALG